MSNIEKKINRYKRDFKNKKLTKPEVCEKCKESGCLIWWSQYFRNLITLTGIINEIPIKRVKCKKCRETFCVLPDFIVKFCHYGKEVVAFALKELKKSTYEKVAEKLWGKFETEYNFAVRTLILWKRKYTLIQLNPI